MNAQPSLFDAPATAGRSRKSDPVTSVIAGKMLPVRERQGEVLIALRHMVGLGADAAEIKGWLAAEFGLDRERNEVASRLAELERMEPPLVRKVGVKQGRRGRPVATWSLTHAGREVLR